MKLTAQEAVRIGNALRLAVQSEDFDYAVEALKAQYRDQYEGSDYGDTQVRENAFQQIRALEELVTTINTFVAIADAEALEVDGDLSAHIFE